MISNYLSVERFLPNCLKPAPTTGPLKTAKQEKPEANAISLEGYAHLFQTFLDETLEISSSQQPNLKILINRRDLFLTFVNESPVKVTKIKVLGGYLHFLLDDFYKTQVSPQSHHEKLPQPSDSDVRFIFESKETSDKDEATTNKSEKPSDKCKATLDELIVMQEWFITYVQRKGEEQNIFLTLEEIRKHVLIKDELPYFQRSDYSNDRYGRVNCKLTKGNIPQPNQELIFKSHLDTKGMFTFDRLSIDIRPMLEDRSYIPTLQTSGSVTCKEAIHDWVNRILDAPPGTTWGTKEWMRLITFQHKGFQLKNPIVEKEVIEILLENGLKGETIYQELKKTHANHLKPYNNSLSTLVISACNNLETSDSSERKTCMQDTLKAFLRENKENGFEELINANQRKYIELVVESATPEELDSYLPQLPSACFDLACKYLPKVGSATLSTLFSSLLTDAYTRENITDGLRLLPLLTMYIQEQPDLLFTEPPIDDSKPPSPPLPSAALFWLLGMELHKASLATLKTRKRLLKSLTRKKIYSLNAPEIKRFQIQLAGALLRIEGVQAKTIIKQFHQLGCLKLTPTQTKTLEAHKKTFQTASTSFLKQKEWSEKERKIFRVALPTMLKELPKATTLLCEHFKAAQESASFAEDLAFAMRALPTESKQTLVNTLSASIRKVDNNCSLWDEILSIIPAYIKKKTHNSILPVLVHMHQKAPHLREAIGKLYHEIVKGCSSDQEKRNLMLASWKMVEDYLEKNKMITMVEDSLVSEIRNELSEKQLKVIENELKKLPFKTATLWPRLFRKMKATIHANKISDWLWIGEDRGLKKANSEARVACWIDVLNTLPKDSIRKFLNWGLEIPLRWDEASKPELSALTIRLVERCFDIGLPSKSEEKDFQTLLKYAKDCQNKNPQNLAALHSVCLFGYTDKKEEVNQKAKNIKIQAPQHSENQNKALSYFFANHPSPPEIAPYPKKGKIKFFGMEDHYHVIISQCKKEEDADKLLEMRKTYFRNANLLELVDASHAKVSFNTLKNLVLELFSSLEETEMNMQAISTCNAALTSLAKKQSYRDEQDFEDLINDPRLSLFSTNNYIASCRLEVLPTALRTRCLELHTTHEQVSETLKLVIDFAEKHDKPFFIERWLPHIARELAPEDFIKVLTNIEGVHQQKVTTSFFQAIATYIKTFHEREKDPIKTLSWLDEIFYIPWVFCHNRSFKMPLEDFFESLNPKTLSKTNPIAVYRAELHFNTCRYLTADSLTILQKAKEVERSVMKCLAMDVQIPIAFGIKLVETAQLLILNHYPEILKSIYETLLACVKRKPFIEIERIAIDRTKHKKTIRETIVLHNLLKVGNLLLENIKDAPYDSVVGLHTVLHSLVCEYIHHLRDLMEKQPSLPDLFPFSHIEELTVRFFGQALTYLEFSHSTLEECLDKILPHILKHSLQKEPTLIKDLCILISMATNKNASTNMKKQTALTISKLFEYIRKEIQSQKFEEKHIDLVKESLKNMILACADNGILKPEEKHYYLAQILVIEIPEFNEATRI